jgi:hypothetical protein
MVGVPFYISNFVSWFIKKQSVRHRVRGRVNSFLYTPIIKRFIKKTFHEKTKTVCFVRQHTPSRFVCVVNDKYFIKVFKHNPWKRMKNFEFLVNYIAKKMSIKIPRVYVSKNNHMYATPRIQGRSLYDFDKEFVLKHEKKILIQVDKIIRELQSIDIHKIPNATRFTKALESTSHNVKPEPITADSVLTHNDLNVRNLLFDKDMNICGLIDFDGLCITNDKTHDKQTFMKYWNRYKEKSDKKQTPLK